MHKGLKLWCVVSVLAWALAGVVSAPAVAQEPPGKGLGSCANVKLTEFLVQGRPETVNDIQQSWVGDALSQLVASWGAPTSTFENRDGTRILTWKDDDWAGNCTQSFEVNDSDVVTRWNNHGCPCRNGSKPKRLSKDTPVPEMTL